MSNSFSIDEQIRNYLGPEGIMARNLNGYEYRPQQLKMASLIRRALDERRFCLVEAGTGTGKTLAYLIPALLSGRRVVISTATKTLQDQIVGKDLPLLRNASGMEFKATVLKGRQNYLCRYRLEQALSYGQVKLFSDQRRAFQRVCDWAKSTSTGEWTELDLPDGAQIQRELSCTSESCPGRKCPYSGVCFVTRARHEAAESDLIIVNHHLLFADLALKTDSPDSGAGVIPGYQAVVFDEAHAVEDVATDFFGLELSLFRIHSLEEDAVRVLADKPDACPFAPALLDRISQFGTRFFNLRGIGLSESDSIRRLTSDDSQELEEQAESLVEAIRALPGALEPLEAIEKESLIRRARQLAGDFDFLTAADDPRFVYWEENRGGRRIVLRCAPIDVAGEFRRRLYTTTDTIVFTSATLASEGRLDFTRRRLGLPGAGSSPPGISPEISASALTYRSSGETDSGQKADDKKASSDFSASVDELILDSPFDYQVQAALYTPCHLPAPNDPGFLEKAADEIEVLCRLTEGRALLLFTSLRNMNQAHAILKRRLPFEVLRQDDGAKSSIIRRFMEEPSVLFASQSFWEGVDIPGDALSLVVIDRLPFASPSDPVVSARVEWLKSMGHQPFPCYQLPQAALALRQGFGRLIRTKTDTGIVAVLDTRLSFKGYGRTFLKSLPPALRCSSLDQLQKFWKERRKAPAFSLERSKIHQAEMH